MECGKLLFTRSDQAFLHFTIHATIKQMVTYSPNPANLQNIRRQFGLRLNQ